MRHSTSAAVARRSSKEQVCIEELMQCSEGEGEREVREVVAKQRSQLLACPWEAAGGSECSRVETCRAEWRREKEAGQAGKGRTGQGRVEQS